LVGHDSGGQNLGFAITSVSSNTTLGYGNQVVLVDCAAGFTTVTLPTAVGHAGQQYIIKRVGSASNRGVVNTTSSQTIDGVAAAGNAFNLRSFNETLAVISDGANWKLTAPFFGITANFSAFSLLKGSDIYFDGSLWAAREYPPVYHVQDYSSVQAAIDAAEAGTGSQQYGGRAGGIVLFPPGIFTMTAELTVSGTSGVILQGAGKNATQLKWSSDLGAGKYALKPLADHYNGTVIRDMTFTGPLVGTVQVGVRSVNMHGILQIGRMILENVDCGGFNAGLVAASNHTTTRLSNFEANYYGLYRILGNGTNGDNVYDCCDFGANAMASLAVAGDVAIDGDEFRRCHMGFTPYGIYGETKIGGNLNMLQGSRFYTSVFEQVGNSCIKSQDRARAVNGVNFHEVANVAFQVGSHLAGEPNTAVIDVLAIYNCQEMQFASSQGAAPGTAGYSEAVIRTAGSSKDFNRVQIVRSNLYLQTTVPYLICTGGDTAGLPVSGCGSTFIEDPTSDGSSVSGVFYRSVSVACTAGDLLMDNGAGLARPYDSTVATIPHWPVGFCFVTRALNDIVEVVTSGQMTVSSTGTIAAGKLVKPDSANVGKVVAATGWADGPIVGMAVVAASGGFVVIQIFLNR
jgi:hypothetical protein